MPFNSKNRINVLIQLIHIIRKYSGGRGKWDCSGEFNTLPRMLHSLSHKRLLETYKLITSLLRTGLIRALVLVGN